MGFFRKTTRAAAIAPQVVESAKIGSSRTTRGSSSSFRSSSFRIGSFRILGSSGSFRELQGSKADHRRMSGSFSSVKKIAAAAPSTFGDDESSNEEEEYYDTSCTSRFIPDGCATDEAGRSCSSSASDQEYSSSTPKEAAAAAPKALIRDVAAHPIVDHVLLLRKQQQASRCNSITKPHKQANDMGRWEAIQELRERDGAVGFGHFKLIRRLGCGDIGSVYLCELRTNSNCYFAMKVMDKGALAQRNKLSRAQTEKDILASLDHPFLPTLYAHFDTSQFSCLLMEFCSGGDLHSLRQTQPAKCFTHAAAKFYAAEVLLALEYLHMMGVVYRDLKPENVLVREDGHIMLSDFDLSLRCAVSPTLIMFPELTSIPSSKISQRKLSMDGNHSRRKLSMDENHSRRNSMDDFTLEPNVVDIHSCVPMMMSHKFLHLAAIRKKSSSFGLVQEKQGGSLRGTFTTRPELVVEPTEVRSMSFVGTHEYLAPEIISGDGHGSSVDWWTFGIFLYELLYAKTPFKGANNEVTLTKVVSHPLLFPSSSNVGANCVPESAKDLIRGLLVKNPMKRLGSLRGAGEIKSHSFFEGVNWALVRCAIPPEIPKPYKKPTEMGPEFQCF